MRSKRMKSYYRKDFSISGSFVLVLGVGLFDKGRVIVAVNVIYARAELNLISLTKTHTGKYSKSTNDNSKRQLRS
jgi:hypothetical protein